MGQGVPPSPIALSHRRVWHGLPVTLDQNWVARIEVSR